MKKLCFHMLCWIHYWMKPMFGVCHPDVCFVVYLSPLYGEESVYKWTKGWKPRLAAQTPKILGQTPSLWVSPSRLLNPLVCFPCKPSRRAVSPYVVPPKEETPAFFFFCFVAGKAKSFDFLIYECQIHDPHIFQAESVSKMFRQTATKWLLGAKWWLCVVRGFWLI